jgi:iron-sulfur cluster insertion protein
MRASLKAQIFITGQLQGANKKYCLLSVLAGGCSGMQYSVLFADELPKYEIQEIASNIYVDCSSLTYLENCILDLEETSGSKKIVIKNPDAKSSCSCGSSFSI